MHLDHPGSKRGHRVIWTYHPRNSQHCAALSFSSSSSSYFEEGFVTRSELGRQPRPQPWGPTKVTSIAASSLIQGTDGERLRERARGVQKFWSLSFHTLLLLLLLLHLLLKIIGDWKKKPPPPTNPIQIYLGTDLTHAMHFLCIFPIFFFFPPLSRRNTRCCAGAHPWFFMEFETPYKWDSVENAL